MSYYKRIASSTELDVLCRWDGEDATREAGGHEFESPHTHLFCVKNHVTCNLCVCEGLPGIFNFFDFFDASVPPLVPIGITNRD
jgi:hypothetical protein